MVICLLITRFIICDWNSIIVREHRDGGVTNEEFQFSDFPDRC